MLDQDGYPDEQALAQLGLLAADSFAPAMELLREHWIYPCGVIVQYGVHRVTTGGWSGHEDMIEALRGNQLWWMFNWRASARGGLFLFAPVGLQADITLTVGPVVHLDPV